MGKNLIYTLAFDPPAHGGTRQMVRMLAASIMRTIFDGEILIFRNNPQPLFLIPREGVNECCIQTPFLTDQELAHYSMAWKPKARAFIHAPEQYEWIMFLDADCLVLRNFEHLLESHDHTDILYQPEPGRTMMESVFNGYLATGEFDSLVDAVFTSEKNKSARQAIGRKRSFRKFSPAGKRLFGINSGTWAVRGIYYQRVMEEWDRIQQSPPALRTFWTEQSAWNRLILDAPKLGLRAEPFEPHEIQFPLHLDKDWRLYRDAAIVHCLGATLPEKIEFMFGLYLQKFFHDPACTLLTLLDT